MTRKQIEDERDRLANDEVHYLAFKAGFDAAVRLMEEHRVRPLREALLSINYKTTFPGEHEDEHLIQRCLDISEEALAQVEEWSE